MMDYIRTGIILSLFFPVKVCFIGSLFDFKKLGLMMKKILNSSVFSLFQGAHLLLRDKIKW
jgi:hypothetical protein